MRTLTKTWWQQNKSDYIFDPHWFEVFKALDPRLVIPKPLPDGTPNLGKMGVVFWHEEDGKTIVPVGITYREGNEFLFCYHPDYVADPATKAISVSLPKENKVYRFSDENALLPYFDNLVAERWLGMMQYNASHKLEGKHDILSDPTDFYQSDNGEERYTRLLLFGRGFAGAVAVVDAVAPDDLLRAELRELNHFIKSESTIGGAQPKMLAVKHGGYTPAQRGENSTHIAKLRGHIKILLRIPKKSCIS